MSAAVGKRKIFGVGINDVPGSCSIWVDGKKKNSPEWTIWHHMIRRCYSEHWLEKYPTYIGASVAEEWLYVSNFLDWIDGQNWKGRQLDKDLLYPENKIYSKDTCIFVPQELNKFVTKCRVNSTDLPLGVSRKRGGRSYIAVISRSVRGENNCYIGSYKTPEEAHRAWQEEKLLMAKYYSSVYSDEKEFTPFIERWISTLSSDLINDRETINLY